MGGGWWVRVQLAGCALGILVGLGLWAAGLGSAADLAWAATTLLGLLPLLVEVAAGLVARRVGVDLIALLAMAGALPVHEYLAGAIIAVMLASGRSLEEYAAGRAGHELSALLSRAPRTAHRYVDGELSTGPVEEVAVGDRLLVKPGEVVPVDGIVASPTAVLDESALTGESRPVERAASDQVRSGVVNAGPPFDLRAIAAAEDSTYAGIVRLVRQAQRERAPFARLADRYALAFVPLTLLVSGAAWAISGSAVRALAVLVVATPCPLILAVPIAIVSGISRAARRGVIVKNGGALEALARGRSLLFDKTGTLTTGTPHLAGLESFDGHGADEILRLAASLDQVSPHVLASAIVRASRERGLPLAFPSEVVERPGAGIEGVVEGHRVRLGSLSWAGDGRAHSDRARQIRRRAALEGASNVFVAVDGEVVGALVVDDPIRPDAPRTVRALRRAGVGRVVMITGDHPDVAETVGTAIGVDGVLAERSPEEKVDAVRQERAAATTVMVGDGINDAPALAAADVGVAMGARGATASSEAADVVVVVDRLDRLVDALRIARRSRAIAVQSVIAGMGMSLGAMVAASFGYLPPVAGALLQEAIDVMVIVNALRALRPDRATRPPLPGEVEIGTRVRAEHRVLLPLVDELREVADRLDVLPVPQARLELERIRRFLLDQLLPHEHHEASTAYPAVSRLMGGEDPMGTMERGHMEIEHLTRLYGRLVDDLADAGEVTGTDLSDVRRVLYGLHAVLRLHFAEEEEAYLLLPEPLG